MIDDDAVTRQHRFGKCLSLGRYADEGLGAPRNLFIFLFVSRIFAPMRMCWLFRLSSLLLAALGLMLSACSSVTSREPAPIVTATVLPAEEPPAPVCLPAPVALEPQPPVVIRPTPPPRPIHRPVYRPRPKPRLEPEKPEVAAPAPPPAPTPLVSVRDVAVGQLRGVLDAQVRRPNGNVIGRAVDATATTTMVPRAIVVNLVGFMGVGDRKVGLPWSAMRFDPSVGKPPIILRSDALNVISSAPASGGSPAPGPGGLNLLDADVKSKAGAVVGRVVDLLLDSGAQPRAVVLDVSGSVFHDKHLIAADWSTLRVQGAGDGLYLQTNLNNREIEASPPYESGKALKIVSPAPASVAPIATAASGSSSASAATSATPAASASATAAAPVARGTR